jgi:cytochrome c553
VTVAAARGAVAALLAMVPVVRAEHAAFIPEAEAWAHVDGERVDFDRAVRPILAAKCLTCHGPDADARKAGLRLDTREGAIAALKSGHHAILPGDPAASGILARVVHEDPSKRMPPDGREPLTAAEVETLRRWIEQGADYTPPWAFGPMRAVELPEVRDSAWPRSDIDRFVLRSREARGLPAPADIDPASLLRRASFDIRGLPPSEAEVRAFAADPSDAAFAAFVDRALASQDFGERWGRHWLDLARYAESLGHEFDYDIPEAWRYRDYVIQAFNADLPPARFIAEQIAGDLLEPRAALGLANAAPIGTAWWFFGPATHAPVDVRQDEADRIAGKVDVAGRSLFGLSIACARCHDHKFDPIPARDYFALAGVARNTRRVEGFLDTDPAADTHAAAALRALGAAAAAARLPQPVVRARGELSGAVIVDSAADGGHGWQRSGHAFVATGAPLALAADGALRVAEPGTIDSARVDLAQTGSARSPTFAIAKRFLHVRVRGHDAWLRLVIDNYWLDDRNALLFEGMRRRLEASDAQPRDPRDVSWRIETFDLARFPGERAYVELVDDGGGWIEVDAVLASDTAAVPSIEAWDEDPAPDATSVLPAPEVERARVRAIAARESLRACTPPARALVAEEGGAFDEPIHVRGASRAYGEIAPRARLSFLAPFGSEADGAVEGSGRLALASVVTSPDSPFLWRTLANRVWLKLLGQGIVETPDDFGQLGAAPTDEALLDHLALKLARGATFKSLIREVVLSRTYRAAPDDGEIAAEAWHAARVRRLDAEAIRDAMLAASGRLDATRGGPSVPVHLGEHMQGRGRPVESGPVDGAGRRSVYIAIRRNFLDPFMQVFDQPPPATSCGRRHVSNVPAQALAILNSELVHALADHWGARLAADARGDDERIESMWFAAYARAPREDEISLARGFLAAERAAVGDEARREAAAFAALAHVVFASKEFIYLR